MQENLRSKKAEERKNTKNEKGITLVALVVTIVVLLILAGVSIVTLFGESGIIKKAQAAKDETERGVVGDTTNLGNLENDMNKALGGGKDNSGAVKVKLADGTEKVLTKENYGAELGKVVINYTGAPTTVQETTVSNVYRLYYVDFDGKYGEKNAVYLKADCINNKKVLPRDTASADDANVKIKQLNPGLYNAKDASRNTIASPTATNKNMQRVTWLTNTTNWESLKTGVNAEIANKINYVVGAPSLEMMMDSYNAHYGLTGDTPDTTTILEGTTNRVKLFYKYPYDANNYGYAVAPSKDSSATNGYYLTTSDYSVKTDASIDSMYYPGSDKEYWLASPCCNTSYCVMYMHSGRVLNGGHPNDNYLSYDYGLCPLVSLKSSVQLELGA